MTEKAGMKVFEHPDDIYTVPQQTSRPRSYLFSGIAAASIVAAFSLGAYVADFLPDPKTEIIHKIYSTLDKDEDKKLSNAEALPLEDMLIALPVFATAADLQQMLGNRPLEDLQKILNDLVK